MGNVSIETLINHRAHATKAALKKLGIKTLEDALEFLPFRYEDRTNVVKIAKLNFEVDSVIIGKIRRVSSRKSKRGLLIVQAKIEDESGQINAIWFNQRYLLKTLKKETVITLYGVRKRIPDLDNPFFVKSVIEKPEICPIYHRTAGISQAKIRSLINRAVELIDDLPNLLPDQISKQLELPDRKSALIRAHRPKTMDDLQVAQKLLAAEELLLLALAVERSRLERLAKLRPKLVLDSVFLRNFVQKLPFKLTDSQRKAAWEIIKDLQKPYPMNRLLYGEAGSGKTAVAAVVAAAVLKNGKRVAVLCPTLSLAEQQHQVFSTYFEKFNYQVGLITSKSKNEQAQIVVGTHSLIKAEYNFDLVIIDEQHRFGVYQRQFFLEANPNCDVLMMSATPIPRTFAQTLLRHLDVTYLSQRPLHQKPVTTKVFSENERSAIEKEIAKRLLNREPGYVICPRINEATELIDQIFDDKKSVQSEVRRLARLFPQSRIGEIHGQADSIRNTKTLQKFRRGEIDILVATTIVEIGIDNPNATWILIENADHFGLSTLHQLRGRVGRGAKESVCYVANTAKNETSAKRLQAFSKINNGLELSEIDLELRGPGELTGASQSGEIALRYASWSDKELLKTVFALARKMMDDGLEKYPLLQERLKSDGGQPTI
jgi:ATP-dependent DNA helicase RecG